MISTTKKTPCDLSAAIIGRWAPVDEHIVVENLGHFASQRRSWLVWVKYRFNGTFYCPKSSKKSEAELACLGEMSSE